MSCSPRARSVLSNRTPLGCDGSPRSSGLLGAAGDGEPDAYRRRALAWLDDPNAKAGAKARLWAQHDIDAFFDLMRWAISHVEIPEWTSPVDKCIDKWKV